MEATPENAQSWRDPADQLTDKQIEELEEDEENPATTVDLSVRGGFRSQTREELRDGLLGTARRYAKDNLLDRLVGPVALPSGFDWACPWEESADGKPPHRFAFADRHAVGDRLCLSTAFVQFADGNVGDDAIEVPTIDVAWSQTDTGIKFSSSDELREAAAAGRATPAD